MLTNAQLAELLARAAEENEGHRQRALRSASRAAYHWPEEVADIVERGDSLRDLPKIGGWLSGIIRRWLEDPPEVPDPPPIRAGFRTFAEALAIVADNPEWSSGLRGDLQMHTEYSDGKESIVAMAGEGAERGYEYIAITDHSKGLRIAGGMHEEELLAQIDEIDVVNEELRKAGHDIRVLRALEMNINPQGEGDMEPESLEPLDLVLGSFHSSLRTKDDQTDRYLAAVRNPHFQILGHPRGRKYDNRLGLQADWPRVFEEATKHDKAIEINSFPDRQDLNSELLEIAREAGVRVSIGTDAHDRMEMRFIPMGVAAAIKAGIDRERVINYMSVDDLVAWAKGH
ncbi:MAG TPA: PHP domain-containing protein [Actinomycetota bacterium]|nr:PHP domain-containing protein [Actinomycetota bacterium]